MKGVPCGAILNHPRRRWGIAATLSLTLHFLLVGQFPELRPSMESGKARARETILNFRVAAPKVETPLPAPPRPPPENKPPPKPESPPEPAPMPEPLPEPPRPEAIRPVEPPARVASPPLPATRAATLPPSSAPGPEAAPSESAPPDSETIRRQYLAKLLSHIEQYKFYPLAARRRGVEGTVRISLRVLADGSIDDLKIEGDHQLLLHAATDAVRRAQPLPGPPPVLAAPLAVHYGMIFKIE